MYRYIIEACSARVSDGLATECWDDSTECEAWAERGECANNLRYMELYCRLSCGLCKESVTTSETACVINPVVAYAVLIARCTCMYMYMVALE